MAFSLTDRQGAMHPNPPPARIDAVLAELDAAVDDEHPDVSLTHESEWCLTAFPSGLLVWENVEEDDPAQHMKAVTRAEVRRLWQALADGDIANVRAQPWEPGSS